MKKDHKEIAAITLFISLAAFIFGCVTISPSQSGAAIDGSNQSQQQNQTQASGQQQAQQNSPFWTGDGGRGIRLGILVPQSQGLRENQEYLPAMVQGILVSNFSQFSAISVLDRVSLDRVIVETLDPTYEEDWDIVSLGRVAQVGHMLTGSIIQTAAGFSLHFTVTDTTPAANVVASYSGTCTAVELDNHSAIHRASLELLSQMNVQLTARARSELGRASTLEAIQAQTALARGVTAERHGYEIAALSYYLQATEFDPLLSEAESRLNIVSTAITRSSAGVDARGEIQLRNQWISRLRETEEFLAQFLRENPAFYLVYSISDEDLQIDFVRETATIIVNINSLPEPMWFESINRLIRTVRGGLMATGRADTWRLNWPAETITTPSPFAGRNTTYSVIVELLNANGVTIGRQTVSLPFDWNLPSGGELSGTIVPRIQFNTRLSFPGINVNIIDDLSVRISSINGRPAESMALQLGIRILPEQEYNRIQSIRENGLTTDNLSQFDIRFVQGHNRLNGYRGSGTSITIPYGVSLIDENSGMRERGFVDVRIPSSVTIIGSSAFRANSLTSMIIPDSVTSIGQRAFERNQFTNVTIGNNVTSIANMAFYGSSGSPPRVIIGANVQMQGGFSWIFGEVNDFADFYNNSGRRAGIYTWSTPGSWNGRWTFSGQ